MSLENLSKLKIPKQKQKRTFALQTLARRLKFNFLILMASLISTRNRLNLIPLGVSLWEKWNTNLNHECEQKTNHDDIYQVLSYHQ